MKNWIKKEFANIVELSKTKIDPKKEKEGFVCIELEHIEKETGRLIGTTSSKMQLSTKNVFHKGDILFGKLRPNLRKYLFAEFDGVCSSEIWVLKSKNENYGKFIFYLIQQEQFIRAACVTSGSKMPRADWKYISSLPVWVPSLPEQKAIASLLSVWDEAIEKTERLIKAKEKFKKHLMKKLLTGKLRNQCFSKKWKEFFLGELFKERKETRFNTLPLLSITKENGVIPREEVERIDTSNKDKSKYLRICPGDIGYNTMRMWQGVSALSELEGIVSPAYTICTPNSLVDGKFMSYLFKLPKTIHLFYRYSQGLTSDTWNLKFHNFAKIKVTIPEKSEQIAISEILQTYDHEIKLLRNKLELLKAQKRGLMQKLLTGKWRVRVNK